MRTRVSDSVVAGDWPYTRQRVRAIAPLVLDGLNFHSFLHLHFGAYGGWSFAMRAFVDANFTGRIDTVRLVHCFHFYSYTACAGRTNTSSVLFRLINQSKCTNPIQSNPIHATARHATP